MSSEEEYSEEEEEQTQDDGPSEAEIAMRRRQAAKAVTAEGLDDEARAMLEENAEQRAAMEEEINEMKARSARRKKEREEEEKQAAIRRAEEEKQRKEEEEVRNAEKRAAEEAKKEARAAKMAEFEKWKNNDKPNFVITKKLDAMPMGGDEEGESGGDKKSKEQLEAEKRAILAQRTPKLEIDGFDTSKLGDKAKELHNLIMRLESEKYDLEKTFKAQQVDMMELAEKARQMNKIGRGGLKRVALAEETDVMSERFAGCPAKIEMYSKYERQMDKRDYRKRHEMYHGPQYRYPADRIAPTRVLKWTEEGLPVYSDEL